MAITTRANIIAAARRLAGRQGDILFDLDRQYDEVIQGISRDYPLLRTVKTGSTVEDQEYIPLPLDASEKRFLIVNQDVMGWSGPDQILAYVNTNTLVSGLPNQYSLVLQENRIYIIPPPDDTYTYYFAYTRIHPRAGKSLAYTSGGTHEIIIGDTVTGSIGGATGYVEDVILTSGTWAAGTAAGTFILLDDTGTFQAENLNEGANTNVATISGAAVTADNYQHLYPYDFEEPIIEFLAAKACELIIELAPRAIYWEGRGNLHLRQKYAKKYQTYRAPRTSFWNPNWRM